MVSSYDMPSNYLTVPRTMRENSNERHARERSKERHEDPMGLSVVFEPEKTRSVDIIFVHGLGGTSHQTWSKNRDEGLFWPGQWLPSEPDICTARVLSFGYNAHFRSTGPNSIANISDFAKDLLYDMRFGKDKTVDELGIGKVVRLIANVLNILAYWIRYL